MKVKADSLMHRMQRRSKQWVQWALQYSLYIWGLVHTTPHWLYTAPNTRWSKWTGYQQQHVHPSRENSIKTRVHMTARGPFFFFFTVTSFGVGLFFFYIIQRPTAWGVMCKVVWLNSSVSELEFIISTWQSHSDQMCKTEMLIMFKAGI